ncbi:hypothetical protein OH77DRAFT_1580380 [Trametes cingulata]|nr:hypothetical protein OH77DRAFT_1580380 [Trametes cingulata]
MFVLTADTDLIDYLFSYLEPDDIMRMFRLNLQLHYGMENYVRRAWDIHRFYAQWFPCGVSAGEVLDRYGAIISGSAALRFMARQPRIPTSGLDIFVNIAGLLRLGRWLKVMGYVYRPRGHGPHLFDIAALGVSIRMQHRRVRSGTDAQVRFGSQFEVFDFYLDDPQIGWARGDRHIQLIALEGSPYEHVLGFHSTAVMNFMTGSFAMSIFPKATFISKVSYVCRSGNESYGRESWKAKYAARGFALAEDCPRQLNPLNGELRPCRFIGDSLTWILPFDPAGTGA